MPKIRICMERDLQLDWLPTHYFLDDDPNMRWTGEISSGNMFFFYKNNKNTEKNIEHKCKENDWQAIMSISSAPDNSINSPTT